MLKCLVNVVIVISISIISCNSDNLQEIGSTIIISKMGELGHDGTHISAKRRRGQLSYGLLGTTALPDRTYSSEPHTDWYHPSRLQHPCQCPHQCPCAVVPVDGAPNAQVLPSVTARGQVLARERSLRYLGLH